MSTIIHAIGKPIIGNPVSYKLSHAEDTLRKLLVISESCNNKEEIEGRLMHANIFSPYRLSPRDTLHTLGLQRLLDPSVIEHRPEYIESYLKGIAKLKKEPRPKHCGLNDNDVRRYVEQILQLHLEQEYDLTDSNVFKVLCKNHNLNHKRCKKTDAERVLRLESRTPSYQILKLVYGDWKSNVHISSFMDTVDHLFKN